MSRKMIASARLRYPSGSKVLVCLERSLLVDFPMVISGRRRGRREITGEGGGGEREEREKERGDGGREGGGGGGGGGKRERDRNGRVELTPSFTSTTLMKSTKVQTLGAVTLHVTTDCTDDASIAGLGPLNWAIV